MHVVKAQVFVGMVSHKLTNLSSYNHDISFVAVVHYGFAYEAVQR